MDCGHPFSVHGVLQARTLEWVAVPASRGSSWPRDRTCILCVSCTAGGLFTTEPPGKPMLRVLWLLSSHSLMSDFWWPWTAACQASLSFTISQSLLKLISIESVMPSIYLVLCRPLLLLPSIFPRIRVFWNESVLRIRWPKYWSFSFNVSPSNEYSMTSDDWFPLGWTGWISLQSKGFSRVFSDTTVQRHQFFGTQLSL